MRRVKWERGQEPFVITNATMDALRRKGWREPTNRDVLRGELPWNYCPVCGWENPAKNGHEEGCSGKGLG